MVPLNEFTQLFLQQFHTTPMEQPKEVLCGHFMTTLNDIFERELTLEDEGYESGSKFQHTHSCQKSIQDSPCFYQ